RSIFPVDSPEYFRRRRRFQIVISKNLTTSTKLSKDICQTVQQTSVCCLPAINNKLKFVGQVRK
ncbi:MAG TPA: hypothetical protein PKY59_14060, partial [Pyrinomonadaceae bacterium]|nr:hypothetical protein [Pyrinomonadaceae bacterium]